MITLTRNTELERIASKWCPYHTILVDLLTAAETKIAESRADKFELSYSLKVELGMSSGVNPLTSTMRDASEFIFSIYKSDGLSAEPLIFKENLIVHYPVHFEFLHAKNEAWLVELDMFLKHVVQKMFTYGMFSVARMRETSDEEDMSL